MVQNSEEEVYIGVVFEINDSIINTINQIVWKQSTQMANGELQ
jgi:hypothetical protein